MAGTDLELLLRITADGRVAVDALKGVEQAVQGAGQAAEGAGSELVRVGQALQGAFQAAGGAAAELGRVGQAVQGAGQAAGGAASELGRVGQAAQGAGQAAEGAAAGLDRAGRSAAGAGQAAEGAGNQLRGAGQNTQRAGEAAGLTRDAFDKLKNVFAGLGVMALAREFIELNSQYEAARNGLTALTGSAEAAGKEMAYIAGVADRLGQSSLGLAKDYLSLAAATKGTALEGEQTRQVFEAVVGAMAKLGKSSAETENALRAVAQMASKGVVAAEEMRGQLGEALPGAMQALSSATGIAVEDLNKMMEAGNLLASDVLPALAQGLNQSFGVDATQRVESLSASFERLKNSMAHAFTDPGQAGLSGAFAHLMDVASWSVERLSVGTVGLGRGLGALAARITGVLPTWADYDAAINEIVADGAKLLDHSAKIEATASRQAQVLQALSGQSLKSAQAYAELADAAGKSEEAIRISGEATVKAAQAGLELAKISGDRLAVLRASAAAEQAQTQAAEANAVATKRVADITRERVAQINAQIATLKEAEQADAGERDQIEAAIKSRQKQIEELTKVLAKQDALAKKSAETAEAERLAAVNAKLAADTYGDQSDQVYALALALEKAKSQYERLQALQQDGIQAGNERLRVDRQLAETEQLLARAMADGAKGTEDLAREVEALRTRRDMLTRVVEAGTRASREERDALQAVAVAQARYADALGDVVRREQEHQADLARNTQLIEREASVRTNHLKVLAEEARSKGDLAKAAELLTQAAKDEADWANRVAEAKAAEADAARKLVSALQEQADADGTLAPEERAQIELAKDVAKAKQLEAEASLDAAAAKEREAEAAKKAADAGRGGIEAGKTYITLAGQVAAAAEAAGLSVEQFWGELKQTRTADEYYDVLQRWADGAKMAKEQMAALAAQAKQLEPLINRLRSGTATAGDLAEAANLAGLAVNGMGNETLNALRDALDDANQKLRDLTDQARSARDALLDELDSLNNNQAGIEQRQYESRKAELEQALKDAQARNDQQAAAAYQEALKVLDEIHVKKMAQIGAEIAAIEARGRAEKATADANAAYQAKRAELEAALAAAQKAGDDAAVQRIKDQMDLLETEHERRLQQIEEEMNAQIAADNAVAANRAKITNDGKYFWGGLPVTSPAVAPAGNTQALTVTAPQIIVQAPSTGSLSTAPTASTSLTPAPTPTAPTSTVRVELVSGSKVAALTGSEDDANAFIAVLQAAQMRAM